MTITVLAFKKKDTKVTHFYFIYKIGVIYVPKRLIAQFYDFSWFSTWKYMKSQQKQGLKGFLAPENHYLDHFMIYHSYRKYIGKSTISVIPSCTQTRISWARRWIFTFCKKWLLCIEKFFYLRSICIFDPSPLTVYWISSKYLHSNENVYIKNGVN